MNETSSQNKTTNEVPNPSFGSIMSETFTKLFVWNARSTRKTFWLGYLVIAIINFVVYQVTMVPYLRAVRLARITGNPLIIASGQRFLYYIGLIFSLYLFLVVLGMMARRLHDTGRNAAWIWLILVPIVGAIVLIVFFCLPTLQEPVKWNKYLIESKNEAA